VKHLGSHCSRDATWIRESVYADLSAPPPRQTSPDIVRVEAFVVSGICRLNQKQVHKSLGINCARTPQGTLVNPYPFSVISPS
jgi:hypothetical protein